MRLPQIAPHIGSSHAAVASPVPLLLAAAACTTRRCTPIHAVLAREEPLEKEELQALSGVWSTALDLDDGSHNVTCHLDATGKVFTTGAALGQGARWSARAAEGSDRFRLKLQLGKWLLTGIGERTGLRCVTISGSVLEGYEDPDCCGRFTMALSMPATADDDLPALEQRHRRRLDARPAPPIRYSVPGIAGRWRLLVSLSGSSMPSIFTVDLSAGGPGCFLGGSSWRSDSDPHLGGTWGLWTAGDKEKGPKTHGTHMWLRVSRERSASNMRGIGGLPIRESFSLWGKPELDSPEAELRARAAPDGLTAKLCSGNIIFGTGMDKEWCQAGRFTLIRVDDEEEDDNESVGDDAAPDDEQAE